MWKLGHAIVNVLLRTDVRSATAFSTPLDIRDYTGDMIVILDSDQTNGSTVTLSCSIQTADDEAFTQNITSDHVFATVTNVAGSNQHVAIKADEVRRYIRVMSIIVGTAPSFSYSVLAIGTKKAR
jgi:hypothetical protein